MKIKILLKPGSKIQKIKQVSESEFHVWVKERPIEGKANQALLKLLSKHFKVPLAQVELKAGQKSKHKTVIIH